MSDGRQPEFRMDISFEELAMLFVMKGWVYGGDAGPLQPSPQNLREVAVHLVEVLKEHPKGGDGTFASVGRLAAWTDPEMPSHVIFGLEIGVTEKRKKAGG